MSMIFWKIFTWWYKNIVRISMSKNKKSITLKRSSMSFMCGDVTIFKWKFCQESMLLAVSKGLYGKYSVLSHVICDLVKTDNDTEKSPNIIENYEIENIFPCRVYFCQG